ncbi:MAG: hypothetical protein JWP12_1539 [Bacteroidetes bacterium]|nr:hypothetical protein [Bacteroidota bacterium]
MWKKNKIALLLTLLLIAAVTWIIVKETQKPKNGYVLISEVYNGFEMKKEMEKKFLLVKNSREKILDSLELELKILGARIQKENEKNPATIAEFTTRRDEYVERKKTYEEDNNALSQKYDKEILAQLNQYVKNYGEENKYAYIFGSDGNGSLMYANEGDNITKEVIIYINNKYKGE